MTNEITLRNWIQNFNQGMYASKDRDVQIRAGWYDWFCKDTSLANKTKKMGSIIKQIKEGGKVDFDKWYVWFKNNCPMSGPLYDDFRFADLENGDVQFTIQINCCWNNTRYAVYGRTPDGEGHWDKPLFSCDTSRELVKWLNTPWEN